eukprot:scaffold217187_cov23-Tisochrysis_lutea.AAC.1
MMRRRIPLEVPMAHGAPSAARSPSGESACSVSSPLLASVFHGSMIREMPTMESGSESASEGEISSPRMRKAASAVAAGCSPMAMTATMAVGRSADAIACSTIPAQPISPRSSRPPLRWPRGERELR